MNANGCHYDSCGDRSTTTQKERLHRLLEENEVEKEDCEESRSISSFHASTRTSSKYDNAVLTWMFCYVSCFIHPLKYGSSICKADNYNRNKDEFCTVTAAGTGLSD